MKDKDKDSYVPQHWFQKSDLDMKRSEILINNQDPEGAAFHLQQSIEKSLKGYLISKGWKLQRIHDLEDLLDYAVEFNREIEEFRTLCQEVTEYYIEERYPILISSALTEDEVRTKIGKAKELILKIKQGM